MHCCQLKEYNAQAIAASLVCSLILNLTKPPHSPSLFFTPPQNAWGVMHWWIRCQLEEYKHTHNGQLPHYSLETRAKMRAEAGHIIAGSLGSVLHVGGHHEYHFDQDRAMQGAMQGAQVGLALGL